MQLVKVFFGPNDILGEEMPTHEQRLERVDPNNPSCPFFRFVGNRKAIEKLQDAAYTALGKEDHQCRESNFAFFGPASAGKTTLARLFAEVVELPFVEISPKSVKTLSDVLREIDRVLKVEGVPLVEISGRDTYILPPCIIFADEIHAMSDSVIQGLLKATEYNDAVMVTEKGKTVICKHVCWMIATTDEGRLFDAFRTRFSPVNLEYLTKEEIAIVVHKSNPDLDMDICRLVSHYNSRVPRKALQFCRMMRQRYARLQDKTWAEVAKEVAQGEGIDELGMQMSHLRILKALGQGPIARNRIMNVVGKKAEEVERYIMPEIMTATEDQDAYVVVTRMGYTITPTGIAELEKRGIPNLGEAAYKF